MFEKKHDLLILPALCIIIICLFPTLINATENADAKALLEKRIKILENGYEKNVSPEETEKLLSEVEVNTLLQKDMEDLNGWGKGEFDKIKNMQIKEMTKIKDSFGYMSYKVSIVWSTNGSNKDFILDATYNLVLKKTGEVYKLYIFERI